EHNLEFFGGRFHMRLDRYDIAELSSLHIHKLEYEETIMPPTAEVLKPHVSINVRNIEASIAFYRKMFGIEPSKVRTGYAKFDVQVPPLNFAFNEVPTLADPGALSHLGFQVASTNDVVAF